MKYYLVVSSNKHGIWGSLDLWKRDKNKRPINMCIKERIAHWEGNDGRREAQEIADKFNALNGVKP